MWIFSVIVFLIKNILLPALYITGIIGGILGVLFVFFGTIVFILTDQYLFVFSRTAMNDFKQCRLLGKAFLLVLSFAMFLIEIPATVCGYILTILKVCIHFAFDKKYNFEGCKKDLVDFEKY